MTSASPKPSPTKQSKFLLKQEFFSSYTCKVSKIVFMCATAHDGKVLLLCLKARFFIGRRKCILSLSHPYSLKTCSYGTIKKFSSSAQGLGSHRTKQFAAVACKTLKHDISNFTEIILRNFRI